MRRGCNYHKCAGLYVFAGLSWIWPCLQTGALAGQLEQKAIPATEKMANIPHPLDVRDWNQVAKQYYELILDPSVTKDSFPAVKIDGGSKSFQIKSYLGTGYANEGFTCLSAVIGAKLVGLDPQFFAGQNYVQMAKTWYDPKYGLYRDNPGQADDSISADIYGYWPAILGLILSAQYPADQDFNHQAKSTIEAFRTIAHGLGCPTFPNYDVLGWNFALHQAGGRNEPMNRFGNAPSVAWVLMVGNQLNSDPDLLACARATMQWYSKHPGRYEISHVMGPLVAARLNVLGGGDQIDLDAVLTAWFGEPDNPRESWWITSGTNLGGITCDGLDGARWDPNGFYAFTMGSLQGPAWLVPVARYQPQYARAIARYALNAANSVRLLEGVGLDADHQDHSAWKAKWDPQNLLFYEGLASSDPSGGNQYSPYARGDPVLNGWGTGHDKIAGKDYFEARNSWFGNTADNIALYMGNHVGFLGGIMKKTAVDGVLRWDCVATDWFHPPSYPTYLYYNPYDVPKIISIEISHKSSIYNAVTHQLVTAHTSNSFLYTLAPDSASVLVELPPDPQVIWKAGHYLVDGIVFDYNCPNPLFR